MMIRILIPVAAMAVLGLLFGVGLAYALKIFGIKIDERVFQILSKLPGSNCGACGKPGCAAFAEALQKGDAVPSGCAVSNEEARMAISEILGIDHKSKVREIATLLCNGGSRAKDKYLYRGIRSCKAATLIFGGPKECGFGCIGFGDCVEACPFDAITMGQDNLPVVDPKKCTACGKCVKACPKNLFKLLPDKVKYYVKCSSINTGAVTAKACKSGCIGCFKCERACPEHAAKVASNLSKIDPEKCRNAGKCFEACPTKVIVKRAL